MQVKPCATSVPNFNSLSLQPNFLWSKEENLLIQIVSRFGIKSLSEVKYAWQQVLDQLMDFKSLNVEQQGKTSATNGPKFNRLSQQTNHLLLKEQDKPLIILSRIGIKTTIKKIICLAITLRLINGFQVCKCQNVGKAMRYKCYKFQLAIVTNKLFMVEGRELTYVNCIKIWDKIAI